MDAAREASERVWLVLDALAAAHPGMPFKEGVLLAQKVYAEVDWMREEGVSVPPDPAMLPPMSWAPDVLGSWAGRQERVTDFLPDRKINAIKELRSMTGAGLKDSKEAIEWLVSDLTRRGVL